MRTSDIAGPREVRMDGITRSVESDVIHKEGRVIKDHIFAERTQQSSISRNSKREEFLSDRSRIVFSSSFRRMMQKAQVFSLESNTSVRNRLTHSLEVADIGRTLTRSLGRELVRRKLATTDDVDCMETIIESACLIHDIGNPPFGHFGEEAIKSWFRQEASDYAKKHFDEFDLDEDRDRQFHDFYNFDGNPQGFRIVTKLHSERDYNGLNLTYSTLLASVKYPKSLNIPAYSDFYSKKVGVFSKEEGLYRDICKKTGVVPGKRYFLVYLMELADDICYCLSDIADGFEKGIITSRDFKHEFKEICKAEGVKSEDFVPKEPIENFGLQFSINLARRTISEAIEYVSNNLANFIAGEEQEISKSIEAGKVLDCLKSYSRKFIYTEREVQRIEIAGNQIVRGLLNHYGKLLGVDAGHFSYFIQKGGVPKGSSLDTEWRVFNQISKRMLKIYRYESKNKTGYEEWLCRARLLVDFVSGMTDNWALKVYQNFMGISL